MGSRDFSKVLRTHRGGLEDRIARRSREQGDADHRGAARSRGEPARRCGEDLASATLEAAYQQIARSYDAHEGGFGGAPKFPRPVTLNFLFRVYARDPRISEAGKHALEMTLFTLRKMAAGGMHDHLGGGFHRYSVDAFWHVPHFEKMLYDQAQLAVAYLDAFQITRDPALRSGRARHSRLRPARHDRRRKADSIPRKMPTA